jgi:hypothetical protein
MKERIIRILVLVAYYAGRIVGRLESLVANFKK